MTGWGRNEEGRVKGRHSIVASGSHTSGCVSCHSSGLGASVEGITPRSVPDTSTTQKSARGSEVSRFQERSISVPPFQEPGNSSTFRGTP